jgi:hypothetical protein
VNNFLANIARRGAGLAPQHRDAPTTALKPAVPLAWGRELASGLGREPLEEQAACTFDHGADIRRPVDLAFGQTPPPQLPTAATLIEASPEKKAPTISSPAVPADTRVRAFTTAPVQRTDSPAAESSDHPVNARREDSIARPRVGENNRQSAARAIINTRVPLAPSKVPGSHERSGSSETEKPAAAKLQPRKVAAPDGVDLVPRSDAGRRREINVAARPVMQEQQVAPAINVLPQPRRDAAQSGPADPARAEQSQIVVKIGKVEVRASQAQRPVRVSRPRGSSGFAEMALRRAHLDRNYH